MAVAIYIRLRAGSAHSILCTYIHSRNLSVISCRQTFGQGHTDCDARMAQQAARRIVRNSEMGSDIVTFDMIDEELIKKNKKELKQPFWTFTRKIYNASRLLIKSGEIDGMIHLTAFGCGPDSVIGKMMEIDCEENSIPFMTVRVDEHTGDNHVMTRLEAFTDMIKMSKRKGVKI